MATAAMPVRRHLSPYPWPLGLAGLALAVGVVSGLRPTLAIAATLAAVFLVLVISNIAFGIGLLMIVGFLEQFSQVAGAISLAKGVGALLAIAWLVTITLARPDERHASDLVARHPALSAAIVLFVAWAATSVVWATSLHAAIGSTTRFALNLALFPIAFAALRKRGQVMALYAVFVTGALLSVAYGLLAAPDPNSPTLGRLSGAGLNPNELGGLLVVAIVLATSLAAIRSWPRFARALALAAAGGCAAGLYLTESRGALFFGLGSALLVAPFSAGRGRRAIAAGLAVLAVVGTVAWFELAASSGAVQRITHPEVAGGSGREELWTIGLRVVEAHPIIGVGAGNFSVVSVHYLFRPGETQRDIYVVDRPLVPHNIYLNVLAEEGIVGLMLFLFVLGVAVRCALRAAHAFARRGDPTMEILARGLFIALVALLTADFFSSQLYNKELWLLLALAPGLGALAERLPARTG